MARVRTLNAVVSRTDIVGERAGVQTGLPLALPAVSSGARLKWSGRVVAGALAAGMLASPTLWLSRPEGAPLSESFPMAAPAPGLGMLAPPPPFDGVLYAGTLVLCALAVVLPKRAVFAGLFLACVFLALPDLLRWQPWFYLYISLLGTLAFVPRRPPGAPLTGFRLRRLPERVGPLTVLQILVACVYLYSGLNKANAAFLAERLQGFLSGMPEAISGEPVASVLTYSAPGLELAAGLGLALGGVRIRHAALALAAGTNLFVLAVLISSGANSVVWPWNLAMVALLTILFAGRDIERADTPASPGGATGKLRGAGYAYAAAVIALFAVLPAAGVLGYWPSYLSWSLYSENTAEAMVAVPGSGGHASVRELAYAQLNVPAYPAPAVYEAAGEQACEAGSSSRRSLVVLSRPEILSGSREVCEYACGSGGLQTSPRGDAR